MVAGAIEGTFALLMSLYHAFELLVIHGAAPFLTFCNSTYQNIISTSLWIYPIPKSEVDSFVRYSHFSNVSSFLDIVEGNGKASNSVVSALRKDGEFLTMLDTVQRWRNNGRVSHHGQQGKDHLCYFGVLCMSVCSFNQSSNSNPDPYDRSLYFNNVLWLVSVSVVGTGKNWSSSCRVPHDVF